MEDLRKEILNLTREYAKSKITSKFIPGESVIPFAGRVFDEEEYVYLVESALDGWLTTGRFAEQFEYEFAKFFGVKSVVLVNSGSSANLLAFSALTSKLLGERRVKPGDEVITVAAGFPTTVNPIIQNGAIPVFLDVDIPTYNIKAEDIEKAVTEKTKAIMVAHTLGNPFNLDEVIRVAKKYNLWVVEDVCDAVGSKYDGKLVGTFGDLATVSFYPAHHITMGEGGAVLTNNLLLERIVKSFRDWGRDCYCEPGFSNTCGMRFKQQHGTLPFGYDHKYVYSHIGYNLKLTDMQAAVGVAQLKKLPSFIKKRKYNFRRLKEGLKKFEEYLILPEATPKSDPSWFGFPITVRENDKFSRWDIVTYLENHKIMTRMLFGGNLTRQPAYQDVKYKVFGELKNTDIIMNQTFFIGVYPGITDEMIDYIIKVFEKFFEEVVR
ncbi:MAG TPA: lipopolysaccharide biosynthesis protein RfbH [Fervidobacterium nodosum]|nr:lipopolysaccharide biosynthesis protein RfbH [Fervidobacterium nodosum]